MHSIKSQARKHAWDPDSKSLGLFPASRAPRQHTRTQSGGMSRSIPRDEEEGGMPGPGTGTEPEGYETSRVHSENCVRTLGELDREKEQDAHPPPRSSTEPNRAFHPQDRGKHTGASDETVVGSSSSSGNSGTTFKNRFFKKKTQESQAGNTNELSTANSTRSTKSHKSRKHQKQHIPIKHQLRCIFWSWPNILLICVPIGIALAEVGKTNKSITPLAIFLINFLAIVPLAGTLSYATEEIALRVGETLGGLLNASFGNATELIVAIIALVKGEIVIVQTSLVGSMLSNLLLVMGMSFALGGYNRPEQHFNVTVAQTACSLLILAGASLIIPTAFTQFSNADNTVVERNVPQLSRGTAIILLFVYGCYLFFQLRTHISTYNAPSEKVEKQNLVRRKTGAPPEDDVKKGISMVGAGPSAGTSRQTNLESVDEKSNPETRASQEDGDEEEGEIPNLSLIGALVTLAGSTALIGVCSEFVVDNISAVAEQNNVPLEFIGLILLPIVGNAAEHATAVTVAIKDKMDLAIGVAVGSSLQIALLVIPLSVIIGWIVGEKPEMHQGVMTLNFDGFIIAVLFVSILLVNYLIQDGKSHWLEGVMLMTTYIIIAVASWFYPNPPGLEGQ